MIPAEKYNSILSVHIGVMVFFFVLLLLLGGIITVIFIPQIKRSKKIVKHERMDTVLSLMLVLCIIAGALTAIVIHTIPYILDVRENAYVTYEGDFAVENRDDLRAGSQPLLSFGDEKHQTQFKLRDNRYLKDGFHTGIVIYSQRSHVIVEWQCDTCEAGNHNSLTASP